MNIFNCPDAQLIPTLIEGIEVYEINKLEIKIFCLPHISGLASGAKNKLLAGKNIEGRYINEKLAYFVINILKSKLKIS